MSEVYTTLPKLVVGDSMDDDDLTDIDDEVFIRDGKNGTFKLDDDDGVKRPLMAPRRKCKKFCNADSHRFPCKALFISFCCGLVALIVLLGLIALCIFTVNLFPMRLTLLRKWLFHDTKDGVNTSDVVPCTSLSSEIVWTRSLPKLASESPLRSNDVNEDGVEDIIVGFSTGLDATDVPEHVCNLYFGKQEPCLGGTLALDGTTGKTIWIHWTTHAIFSVDCTLDITDDKIKDCIISGHGGILHAINGKNGSSIWEMPLREFSSNDQRRNIDVYDAKFIADTDGDEIGDVISAHTVQSDGFLSSEIIIVSGKTGNILHSVSLPNTEQLFIAPQSLVHPDGESIYVLATTNQMQSGGLYITSQVNFMHGNLKLRKLHHSTIKTTLLPPILVDITSDEVVDIIAATFDSTIMAYNGLTFEPIWNYTIPNSKVISIPIPGYYNDDDVPDFMVKYHMGPDFSTYYYAITTIIDGRTGQSLLEKPIEDNSSRQMSGLSVTVDGFGNDWFLHWSANCLNYEGVKKSYHFLKGQNLISKTRANLCKLRFNSTLATNLLALSQHVGPPGISIYSSENYTSLEFNNTVDLKEEIDKYLKTHPDFEVRNTYADAPFVSERSPKVYKNRQKGNIFSDNNDVNMEIGESSKFQPNLSDMKYENLENVKSNEKTSGTDFQNNVLDDVEIDEPWRRENKWMAKQYDVSYDNDNDRIEDDGKSIEYPQLNEIREQRSNIDDNGDSIRQNQVERSCDSEVKIINDKETSDIDDKRKQVISSAKREINNANKCNNDSVIMRDENTQKLEMLQQKMNFKDQRKRIFKRKLSMNYRSKIDRRRKDRTKRKSNTTNKWTIDGVQKQSPTGILLPSLLPSREKTSIDLVFPTYWLPSSEISVILIQEDLDCIQKKKRILEVRNEYKERDDVVAECLANRGINYKTYQEEMKQKNVKIAFGQMTVYRMKLECVCPEDMLPHQSCKNIAFRQSWPEHLGTYGNGYFRPLQRLNV